jgi:hypothetical protein
MKNKRNLNGGYVGLLILLISVSILVLVMFKSNFFRGQNNSKSIIEQDLNAVTKAQNVKNILENDNKKLLEE